MFSPYFIYEKFVKKFPVFQVSGQAREKTRASKAASEGENERASEGENERASERASEGASERENEGASKGENEGAS